jgi:hypothetical protein
LVRQSRSATATAFVERSDHILFLLVGPFPLSAREKLPAPFRPTAWASFAMASA